MSCKHTAHESSIDRFEMGVGLEPAAPEVPGKATGCMNAQDAELSDFTEI